MDFFPRIGSESWRLLQEMAPSLWLGFLVAGLLAVVLPRALVKRHLARPGWGSIFKASLLGSPMPLCSCGVVPVAAELKKLGASPGAVAAFLVSTPQTGVENVLVCLALLGPVFAIASPLVAVLSGLVVGFLVQAVSSPPGPVAAPMGDSPTTTPSRTTVFLRTVFRTLPRDLAWPLLVGLLVSGCIAALVPPGYFQTLGGNGWVAKLVILVVSVPMYVCSAASIPVAASLLAAGLSPGAALVFLMAGPATNGATLAALVNFFGRKGAAVFLAALVGCVLVFAQILDVVSVRVGVTSIPHQHDHPGLAQAVLAVGLVVMLVSAKLRK